MIYAELCIRVRKMVESRDNLPKGKIKRVTDKMRKFWFSRV